MISRFSVKKPYTVIVGVILVIVLGYVSFTRMTTDLLPDMSLPYVLIMTTDVGASPEEVEAEVTAPIEAAMATTSNIKTVSSVSNDSYSTVILEYEQSSNMDSIVIEAQQKLDQLEGTWDDSVGKPVIMQVDPEMMPIMVASADVEGMTRSEVSSFVEKELSPAIESVEGVASVSTTGALVESIQVTMSQHKIDALNKKIQGKIDEQFEDAQEELDEAKEGIEEGREQLEDGQRQMEEQLSSAEGEIDSGRLEAYEGEAELSSNLQTLRQMKALLEGAIPALQSIQEEAASIQSQLNGWQEVLTQLDAEQQDFNEQSSEAGVPEGSEAQPPIDEQLASNPALSEQLGEAQRQVAFLQGQLDQLNAQVAEQSKALAGTGISMSSVDDIPQAITQMTELLAQTNAGIAAMETAKEQVEEGEIALGDAAKELGKGEIEGILEISKASAELSDAQMQLEQGQVQLDAAKDQAKEEADLDGILTQEMLGNLLVAQNFAMPAGYASEPSREDGRQYIVRVGDKVESMEDLRDVVLMDPGLDGIGAIRLSDVAEVEMTDNSADSYSKVDGNPAIMLSIEKQTGYSTGEVTDRLQDRFKTLEEESEGLHMAVLMNQGVYIDIIVESVMQNMIIGALLAVIVLIIFLKDFRPTLVIACSIPLSVIFAIILMYFSSISLNIISLSGLALGIGMLVDNSIVVIENIYRLRNEGYSIRKAAVEGASQVTGAIIASTLTTVCVFAPIIFTEGITRQLFVDLALTIAFTLSASLAVALTFVPMMAAGVLKNAREVSHAFFERIQEGYGKLLSLALKFKPIVIIGSVALLVASVLAAFSRGFAFMDMDMEADQLTITVAAREDQTLKFEELAERTDEVFEKISDVEGIETIGAMIGGGVSANSGVPESATMYLLLDEDAGVSSDEVASEVEGRVSDVDCDVAVSSSASDMTALFGSGLTIRVSGSNLDRIEELAAEVAKIAAEEEGTVDVNDGLDNMTPSLEIRVDKEKAAKYGMTTAQVYQAVLSKMASSTSPTTVSTDLKDYAVYVQTEEQADVTVDDIRGLTLPYTDREGNEKKVSLRKIASFEEGETLSSIQREAQTRYIDVTAGIDDDHNVSLVSASLQGKLEAIDLPEGYSITMAGEDEMISDAMEQLVKMLVLAVIFIYLIMVAQFQSFLSPFIIMFTIPLAFTGGLFALYFTGNEVSVIAMIGFVMLAGIIVNNGIVMVDYINQLRREGMGKKDAIIESGMTRLRPILMTALTTILSMSTMALGLGDGSSMMQPMAIVTEGGLIYGTLLTLFVVPCIYDLFNREKSMVEEEL